MEVDDAACLVLGDLDIPDGQDLAELFLGDSAHLGQVAGQVGGEPAPQFPGAGVEQDSGVVVVAVRAQRTAKARVIVGVPVRAGDVAAVRAPPGVRVPPRTAGQDHRAFPAP